jgi:hypothetical protein
MTVLGKVLELEYVSTTESTTEFIEPTKLVKKDIIGKEIRTESSLCVL